MIERIEYAEEAELLRLVESKPDRLLLSWPIASELTVQMLKESGRYELVPDHLLDWVSVCRKKGFLASEPLMLSSFGRIALRMYGQTPREAIAERKEPNLGAAIPGVERIVNDPDLSAEEKLCRLSDRGVIGPHLYSWTSERLGEFIGVSAPRIRQTDWWKVVRKEWKQQQAREDSDLRRDLDYNDLRDHDD